MPTFLYSVDWKGSITTWRCAPTFASSSQRKSADIPYASPTSRLTRGRTSRTTDWRKRPSASEMWLVRGMRVPSAATTSPDLRISRATEDTSHSSSRAGHPSAVPAPARLSPAPQEAEPAPRAVGGQVGALEATEVLLAPLAAEMEDLLRRDPPLPEDGQRALLHRELAGKLAPGQVELAAGHHEERLRGEAQVGALALHEPAVVLPPDVGDAPEGAAQAEEAPLREALPRARGRLHVAGAPHARHLPHHAQGIADVLEDVARDHEVEVAVGVGPGPRADVHLHVGLARAARLALAPHVLVGAVLRGRVEVEEVDAVRRPGAGGEAPAHVEHALGVGADLAQAVEVVLPVDGSSSARSAAGAPQPGRRC